MAKLRVRARTVDMLGRQQIAGIPSAIHELFKNAHDAYAERVDVDYFHHNNLFVLRDDGMGMSQEDFEGRWLTLGTESKLGQGGLKPPPHAQGKRQRPILGEKGVGRLAIAAIGPQVLVLTRPNPKGSKVVASFLNWGFFELPGIDLDQIEIAVELIEPKELRSGAFVQRLVDFNSKQLRALTKTSNNELVRRIKRELEQFHVNPGELDGALEGASLLNDGHGTQFYIHPADNIIKDELTLVRDEQTASPLEKYLLGFANAWVPRRRPPPVEVHFREHREDATSFDLVTPDQFFSPEEFRHADHHFEGVFDEYGNFRGKVSIYGKEPANYKLKWEGSEGSKTLCGPFTISFAYLPGSLTDSLLPAQEWGEISKKLNRFGGLYVYRNGIRVLPYGDIDFDFLEFEKRRTLGAAYYFYSFRRMFGAIDITHNANQRLKDKAGREGLIQNKAYFQFKEILINFFLATARDFFRKKGGFSDEFWPFREELREKEKLRRNRENYAKSVRRHLKNEVDKFFTALTRGDPESEASKIRSYLAELVAGLVDIPKADLTKKASSLEKAFDQRLQDLFLKYTILIPIDVGLGDRLSKEVAAYLRERKRLKRDIFEPLRTEFRKSFEDAVKKATKALDRRVVGRELLQAAVNQHQEELDKKKASALSKCKELSEFLSTHIKTTTSIFAEEAIRIQQEYDGQTQGKVTTTKLYKARQAALVHLELVSLETSDELERSIATLEAFSERASESGGISRELVAALEEKIENLTNELEEGLELMQLGAALGIVQHEFISTIQDVRSGIAKLEPWADANPELVDIYKRIHLNFEHLSGYLKLFDPFSRRLNPVKIVIFGEEIRKYLRDLFGSRLDHDEIELRATSSFRSKKVEGYTSTFYPVFANLIDNAIYWLSNFKESERAITLDANADGFLVRDNGPGIEPRYQDRIFEFGFTRKSIGRGMGLHISREALRRQKLDLVLLRSDEEGGTTFLIKLSKSD